MILARIINGGRESDDEKIIKMSDLTKKIKEDPSINECGAIFTFEGFVRGKDRAKTTEKIILTTMNKDETEKELEAMVKEVKDKHGVRSIAVVHYLGQFEPGDPLFLAAVAGPHRHETRAALEEIIERVKYELDFKKKEFGSTGTQVILSGG